MKILEFEVKIRKSKGIEYPCSGESFAQLINTIKKISIVKLDNSATDEGTCVLGAGIKFEYLVTRERIPRSAFLFRAPFQGNVGSYKALKPILDFVQKKFPELNFYWEDGNMD